MRLLCAILACLGAASLTPCFADPPASAAAAASQPATSATQAAATPASAPAEAAPATSQSAAAATKTASSPAAAATAAQTLDAEEKQLRDEGYVAEMHNGTKLWCRREEEIGSRLGSRQKVCGTVEELSLRQREAQQQFRQQQAASSVPASSGK